VTTAKPVTPPLRHVDPVQAVAFSRSGRYLATMSGSMGGVGVAKVWDLADVDPEVVVAELGHSLMGTTWFSSDRRRAAYRMPKHDENRILFWDTTNGSSVGRQLQQDDVITRVALSKDGRLIATASKDTTVSVWNVQTGEPHCPVLMHKGKVNYVSFDHDGRRLITTSGDGVHVWELETGEALKPLLQFAALERLRAPFDLKASDEVIFSSKGKYIAEILSCEPLDSTGGRFLLSASEQLEVWNRFSKQKVTTPR